MSLTNIKTKVQSERGFTIVELLIVIVVIAILAAITIVSYNGITNKANSSAAASNAANVQKKIELYAADTGNGSYPVTIADLTNSSNSSQSWYVSGITIQTANPTSSNGKTTVGVLKCSATAPTTNNQANITASNISGIRINYFDFENSNIKTINMGTTTNCPTT